MFGLTLLSLAMGGMAVSRPDPIVFNDAIKTAQVENSMKIGASVCLDNMSCLSSLISYLNSKLRCKLVKILPGQK